MIRKIFLLLVLCFVGFGTSYSIASAAHWDFVVVNGSSKDCIRLYDANSDGIPDNAYNFTNGSGATATPPCPSNIEGGLTTDQISALTVKGFTSDQLLAINDVLTSSTSTPVGTTSTTTTTTSVTSSTSSTSLRVGSTGSSVAQLQNALIAKGYLTGIADGKFGSGTAAALVRFQASVGLTPDGIAGAGTHAALNLPWPPTTGTLTTTPVSAALCPDGYNFTANGCVLAGNVGTGVATGVLGGVLGSANNITTGGTSTTTLQFGSTGTLVGQVQAALIARGYLGGFPDSKFGIATQTGVTSFQNANGLAVTGVVNAQTAAALGLSWPVSAVAAAPVIIGRGVTGANVIALQTFLNALGEFPLTINGTYDEKTALKVAGLQAALGLAITGNIDATTLAVFQQKGLVLPVPVTTMSTVPATTTTTTTTTSTAPARTVAQAYVWGCNQSALECYKAYQATNGLYYPSDYVNVGSSSCVNAPAKNAQPACSGTQTQPTTTKSTTTTTTTR